VEDPILPPQQGAELVAGHGVPPGVHQQEARPVPGLGGQGLQGVLHLRETMPHAPEGAPEGVDQGAVAGDDEEVHGGALHFTPGTVSR